LINFVGIFKQQDLEADDQFKVFAKGLVSIFTLAANKYGSHRVSLASCSTIFTTHMERSSTGTNSESFRIPPLAEMK